MLQCGDDDEDAREDDFSPSSRPKYPSGRLPNGGDISGGKIHSYDNANGLLQRRQGQL